MFNSDFNIEKLKSKLNEFIILPIYTYKTVPLWCAYLVKNIKIINF